jgi:hypothetical protein
MLRWLARSNLLPWAQETSSSNPDAPTKTSRVFFWAYQNSSSPASSLWNSPRREAWICRNAGRQECSPEIIEPNQVKRTPSGQYGENSGDSVHFSCHQSLQMQIGDHAPCPDPRLEMFLNLRSNLPVDIRQEKSTLGLTVKGKANLIRTWRNENPRPV